MVIFMPAVHHAEARGADLLAEVCRQSLEGVVAKRPAGMYDPGAPTRSKIKGPAQSRAVGRRERMRAW